MFNFSLYKSNNESKLLHCISKLENTQINQISSNGLEYVYVLNNRHHTVPFEFLNSMAQINHLNVSAL